MSDWLTHTKKVERLDATYYMKGALFHREDGPAIKFRHSETELWYLDNVQYTEEEWKIEMTNRTRQEKLIALGFTGETFFQRIYRTTKESIIKMVAK